MKDITILKMFGLACIVICYVTAALQGYDGILLTSVIGVIAAVVGVEIGVIRGKAKSG